MAIRAVTGALQGLATGSVEQAIVGGLSPYANLAIKEATTKNGEVNKTANIMAHAILGAVEAQVTGNNAVVGAAGAASAELAARVIAEQLYGIGKNGKEIKDLTESQKETLSTFSQVAAGLAGGLVGDNGQSAVVSAEIGKRAVENNLLSKQDDDQIYNAVEKYRIKGYLSKYEQDNVAILLTKDQEINRLISLYQKDPEMLTQAQKIYLSQELKVIAASYNIPIERLYDWDFTNNIKRNDTDLENYLSSQGTLYNSYDIKQANSLKTGLETAANIYSGSALTKLGVETLPKLGAAGKYVANAAEKYPLLTDITTTAIVNTGYQLSQNKSYDPYSLLQSELSTVLTRNRSLGQQLSINLGISTLAVENDSDYGWNALGAISGTLISNKISKFNVDNKKNKYLPESYFNTRSGRIF